MNRRRSRFTVPRVRGGDSLAATARPRHSSTEAIRERRRVCSPFVFMFAVFAATSGASVVGRVLPDPKDPANVATKDPAYVGQSAGTASTNVGAGQAMYAKAGCETCHGANGQGTAAGPRIAGTTRQLPAFVSYVRKPTGTMPPQSAQVVSDQALADIFAFLRSAPSTPVGRGLSGSASQIASAPAGRAEAGAALYAKIGCYQCHSNQAQGGQAGPRLGPDPIPFARFSQYVRNPTGDMPPYTEKVLSNPELADIYAFVQTRPRPPAVNSIPQLAQ
ncbi:MAG: cytochrome c [Vicinamibacterales bacterium]